MKRKANQLQTCGGCGGAFPRQNVMAATLVRGSVTALIQAEHPAWDAESVICRDDLATYQARYVTSLLESEKGESSSLEQEVLRSLSDHEVLSRNVDAEFEQKWSLGERMADHIADFGGSWRFVLGFGIFILLWVAMNSLVLLWRPVDPYPGEQQR